MTFHVGRRALFLLCTASALIAVVLVGVLRVVMGPSAWYAIPFAALVFVCGWYWPRLIRSMCGELSDAHLSMCYGVWWHRETTVSLDAIRTYELWTPPLHAIFGCRTMVLRFAGGSVWLPLLDIRTARCLAERLEEL